MYYKHALVLLSRAPVEAGVSFLARYSDGLSPMRLLPSIMNYEKARGQLPTTFASSSLRLSRRAGNALSGGVEESKIQEVDQNQESFDGIEVIKVSSSLQDSQSFVDDSGVSMKYLEGVIGRGCRNSAVFSYLLALYTKLPDEEPLYNFLSIHVPGAESVNEATSKAILSGDRSRLSMSGTPSVPLDLSFALRSVLATGRHFRSAIKLYRGLGMRQQAVELALKVDPSLARELAQGSTGKDERRRLWLMIAKSAASSEVARGGNDVVSRVVSVIKDCGPNVLSIEDVLPFLPDFAQIDQIKDEICDALTSYSSKIDSYLEEMNDCDQRCAAARIEIGRLRNHNMRVRADARCAFTNTPVFSAGEPFYAFPSGFVFVESALMKELLPYCSESQRRRAEELYRRLTSGTESEVNQQTLQLELDSILAAECPLTGNAMVESISNGFDVDEETFGITPQGCVDRIDV